MGQAEVARQVDRTKSAVSGWELGKQAPDSESRELLAELLDIPLAVLTGAQVADNLGPPVAVPSGSVAEGIRRYIQRTGRRRLWVCEVCGQVYPDDVEECPLDGDRPPADDAGDILREPDQRAAERWPNYGSGKAAEE